MSITAKRLVIGLSAATGLSFGLSMAHVQQPGATNVNPQPHCATANLLRGARTKEAHAVIRAAGEQWLAKARVCKIGGFTIVVPAHQSAGPILRIYEGRKPILLQTRGESLLYGPTVQDDRTDLPTVSVWHPDGGKVTRLFYDVMNHETQVMVGDFNFDGMPDVRIVWHGHDIREAYGWYGGTWHELRKERLLVNGHWRPAKFSGAAWHLTHGADPHTRHLCDAMSGALRPHCKASSRARKSRVRSLSPRIKRIRRSDRAGPQRHFRPKVVTRR